MYKYIKKCFILVFLIIMIPLLTSCAAGPGGGNQGPSASDGVPFVYYSSFNYNESSYDIFIIKDYEHISLKADYNCAMHFSYKEYQKQEVSCWTINYLENNQYCVIPNYLESDVINSFYENVKNIIKDYENYLNITFDIYQDETIVEKELTATNLENYEKILVIDLLIPFRLVDKYNRQTYNIYIPVKTFLGYKNNDVLKLVYDENHIIETDYYYFIYSENIIKK